MEIYFTKKTNIPSVKMLSSTHLQSDVNYLLIASILKTDEFLLKEFPKNFSILLRYCMQRDNYDSWQKKRVDKK